MECAFCLEMVDDDSFYCDMCGEGVKSCPECKKPSKGKWCTSCGKSLVAANKGQQSEPDFSSMQSLNDSGDVLSKVTATTELRLINNNINIDIPIENGDIVGRTTGQHVSIFSYYKQISGKHCQFKYNPNIGWTVVDLASTFKTAYNDQELIAHKPQKISDQALLKLASCGVISPTTGKPLQSIEFLIRII